MSRDWCAIYGAMLAKPKYRRLTIPARAALFHVWLLAGGTTPEATWSRADLDDQLDLDGFPAGVVDELLNRGWLEKDGDRLVVHDWDDHQLAATAAARRNYEADRKREWRRQRPERPSPSPSPAPHPLDITSQDNTGQVSPSVRDTSGTTEGDGNPSSSKREGLGVVRLRDLSPRRGYSPTTEEVEAAFDG